MPNTTKNDCVFSNHWSHLLIAGLGERVVVVVVVGAQHGRD